MQLTVRLGDRSYPILIESPAASSLPRGLLDLIGSRKTFLVTNTTVAKLYAPLLAQWQSSLGFSTHAIPDGERHKTVDTWRALLDAMFAAGLDRGAVVLALGGGVVGDVAGFAAASYMRGIDFVQIPTTLLAMVDSGVGGKTGVDHSSGKNLIGAFHQPSFVWVNVEWLRTLPQRDYLAGYAELFKYAFIGGRRMFDFVRDNHALLVNQEREALMEGIGRSLRIKAGVVAADEKEHGQRALLNFGHTVAHALEKVFGFEGMTHGEAVWWGMACACRLGAAVGSIPSDAAEAYRAVLDKLILPPLPVVPDVTQVYRAMFSDKKTRQGSLRLVLPTVPGSAVVRSDVPESAVKSALEAVLAASARP